MTTPGSVTKCIDNLKAGDQAAAQLIWEKYFRRLVGLAAKKLRVTSRRAADEEDVVQSALKSFFLGVGRGQFPKLTDRNSLWPLLIVITTRKAYDLIQLNNRLKGGGGKVRGESVFIAKDGSLSEAPGIDNVFGSELTPELKAVIAEQTDRLLDSLGDAELSKIALLKMDGFTNEEIAVQLNCSRATVERKLRLIRRIWEKEMGE
jgi:DNA-directed RNA polymerase specialized sigma24 family protein